MTTNKVTNIPMMQILAKTAILCIVPKTIDIVSDFFFKTKEETIPLPLPSTLTEKDINVVIETNSKIISDNILQAMHDKSSSFNYAGNTINKSASKDASRFVDAQKKPKKKKKVDGKHDTTVFTKAHVRHIKRRYKEADVYKLAAFRSNWFTRADLKHLLNFEFGINKKITSYSDVGTKDFLLGSLPPDIKKKEILIHPEFSKKTLVEIIQEYPSKQYH